MLFSSTLLERTIVWFILAAIAMGLLLGAVKFINVALRRYAVGSTPRNFILSSGAATAIAGVVFWIVWAGSLNSLERDCRRHILAEPYMEGVNGFSADQHIDFWDYGASGGGFVAPWSVEPHVEPKVIIMAGFNRGDFRLHQAWIECHYTKRPDSGDPPQLVFDKVYISGEDVLVDNRFVPWHQPREGK
jgi:hypothetical protein